jgi:hypothetical protein
MPRSAEFVGWAEAPDANASGAVPTVRPCIWIKGVTRDLDHRSRRPKSADYASPIRPMGLGANIAVDPFNQRGPLVPYIYDSSAST